MKLKFRMAILDPVVIANPEIHTGWSVYVGNDPEFINHISGMPDLKVSSITVDQWPQYILKRLK